MVPEKKFALVATSTPTFAAPTHDIPVSNRGTELSMIG
jgi:hypothetical protein